ncbi:ribosomal large subunit pseudouridine synthase [Bifidobacterium merycicum]|uniref:RNA pseudouridylate synthase n=1 Tax=Bifidobacterium merycicum TaxID=78345 RepID=A0A087BHQ1_9BIFI|nr:ribosomal large subunit pseudouridine synthase [Bifidobacterium merycicum]SHE27797.1 tRNA pseudouridine32 synthase / 23S rRNA pseudouridine746 synthase [Bifidobacterium merycicum DSM 6492]
MGHRWVTEEPRIPFELGIVYEDERIIVVDKPHFLATTPRGMWYRETALIRLRDMYDDPGIVPAHRLDRATAGIVVFVRDPASRGAYQMLFQNRLTTKTYECLAPLRPVSRPEYGTIRRLTTPRPFPLERRSRIVKQRGILQAYEELGTPNAQTMIERAGGMSCRAAGESGMPWHTAGVRNRMGVARYVLHPKTGKTHQLRVHMNSLGLPILGDDLYPRVIDRPYDDFSTPLELVARELSFDDPITGEHRRFTSRIPLGEGPLDGQAGERR